MELPNSDSGFFLFNGVFLFQTPRKWSAGIVITAPLYQSKQVLFLLGWFSWRPKLSKETIWEPDTGYNGVHSNTTFFIFLTHQAMHCQLQCWSTSFLSAVKVAEPKIVPLGRPGLVEFLAGLTCPMDKRPSKPSSNKSLTIRQVHVSGPRQVNVRAACPKNKLVIHFFFRVLKVSLNYYQEPVITVHVSTFQHTWGLGDIFVHLLTYRRLQLGEFHAELPHYIGWSHLCLFPNKRRNSYCLWDIL